MAYTDMYDVMDITETMVEGLVKYLIDGKTKMVYVCAKVVLS